MKRRSNDTGPGPERVPIHSAIRGNTFELAADSFFEDWINRSRLALGASWPKGVRKLVWFHRFADSLVVGFIRMITRVCLRKPQLAWG